MTTDELSERCKVLRNSSAAYDGDYMKQDVLESLCREMIADTWEKVITGYIRYKQSLIPKPGCEKFPMSLLMSFEDWCRQEAQRVKEGGA